MVDTVTNSTLIRSEIWASEVKEVLQEELTLDKYIDWRTDFPDGDLLTIPTLSELTTQSYREGEQIKLQDSTTGEYQLAITKYYQSGFRVPDKFKNDSFYTGTINANFVPALMRALMEQKESDIANLQADQTASNPNTINGYNHRFVGTGTNRVGALKDFAKAKLALDKARVSKTGRRAIVDPATTYELSQIADFVYQERIGPNDRVEGGFGTTAYVSRIAGFEVWESMFLDNALVETVVATAPNAGSLTTTAATANMFVGYQAFIGAMRAAPDMMDWYDNNTRSQCYHVTMRYGIDVYRPESLVVLLTD